jgi:hypothetical protein
MIPVETKGDVFLIKNSYLLLLAAYFGRNGEGVWARDHGTLSGLNKM